MPTLNVLGVMLIFFVFNISSPVTKSNSAKSARRQVECTSSRLSSPVFFIAKYFAFDCKMFKVIDCHGVLPRHAGAFLLLRFTIAFAVPRIGFLGGFCLVKNEFMHFCGIFVIL